MEVMCGKCMEPRILVLVYANFNAAKMALPATEGKGCSLKFCCVMKRVLKYKNTVHLTSFAMRLISTVI